MQRKFIFVTMLIFLAVTIISCGTTAPASAPTTNPETNHATIAGSTLTIYSGRSEDEKGTKQA